MSEKERKISVPKILTEGALHTQAEMLELPVKREKLFIGIPCEITLQENRVALIPSAVATLTAHGHRVLMETGAGKKSNYSDHEYSEAGAEIAYSPEQVYQANAIIKVAPPTLDEIELMRLAHRLALTDSAYPSDVKKHLKAPHDELVQAGFLKEVAFVRRGKSASVRYVMNPRENWSLPTKKLAKVRPPESSLITELVPRGISRVVAATLLAQHGEKSIADKLEVFDHLLSTKSPMVTKNPAGFLRTSIEKDFARRSLYDVSEFPKDVVFLFGSERFGLARETCDACDDVIGIPIYGVNQSLPLAVASGIVMNAWAERHARAARPR